jgi:hypothetical protein
VLLERATLVVKKKDMELDEIKYLYLLLYYHYWFVFFFNPIESKKAANLGFRIDKKTKS